MKKTFCTLLAVCMVFCMATFSVSATEYIADESSSGVSITTAASNVHVEDDAPSASALASPYVLTNVSTNGDWTTVYSVPTSRTSGINKTIYLDCQNNADQHNDVRMLGKTGNVVWEEMGAVGNNASRSFWCGPDVYAVQVRIGPHWPYWTAPA